MVTRLFPRVIVMLLVFGYGQSAHAYTCAEPTTPVFFVNGIGNTEAEAFESLGVLKQRLSAHSAPLDCLSFNVAYNHNEPLFLDLVEAWQQKMADTQDFMVTFWLFLGRVVGASDEFLATVHSAVTLIDPPVYLVDADLDEHLVAYRSEIGAGRSVIVVPHSQGNFYANKAWEKLTPVERTSFHLVAAASPSFIVADGGPYTTLDEDKLIASIPFSLPSNLTNGPDFSCTDDWKCHGFKETYLASTTESEDKIITDILALLVVPEPPEPEATAELRGSVTYQVLPSDPRLPAAGGNVTLYHVPEGAPVETFREILIDDDGTYALGDLPLSRYVLFISLADVRLEFTNSSAWILDEPRTYAHDVDFGPLSPDACVPCPVE